MDEERATSVWLVCIALAMGVHAALLAPLIVGREGSDGAATAGGGMGADEPVMVVDSLAFAPVAEATTQMPARDGRPARAGPQAGAVQVPATAAAVPGQGRGAALLPFDVLPIPSPSAPAPKTVPSPKTGGATTAAARPAPTRVRPFARPEPPPEPQPFDTAAAPIPPPPPPMHWSPSSPPPLPNQRSSRTFWFGIWCGRYVACD